MNKTFLIMAGGTGGHVYPALATAQALLEQGARVVWMGSVGGMEARIVGQTAIPMRLISVGGLRGKGLTTLLLAPLKLMRALWQAYGVYRKESPDCVLGMGGFAAGPGGLMALMMSRPLVIHEQNAVAGLTNRLLSKWAKVVLQAFPNTFEQRLKNQSKIHTVGNPVRPDLLQLAAPADRQLGVRKPSLLVLGGSRGAQILNEVVPAALALIAEPNRPLVVHQAGEGKDQQCGENYQALGVAAEVVPFVDDMKSRYQQADLVICRAGALTLAELTSVGLGAVLVPYPHAVDDHQTVNAGFLVRAGAAVLIPQSELDVVGLASKISQLMSQPEQLLTMAQRALALGKPDATQRVAGFCIDACQ